MKGTSSIEKRAVLSWLRSTMRWLQGLPGKFRASSRLFQVQTIDDREDVDIRLFWLYIEVRGGKDRWIHMQCPCSCRELISLKLMTS